MSSERLAVEVRTWYTAIHITVENENFDGRDERALVVRQQRSKVRAILNSAANLPFFALLRLYIYMYSLAYLSRR